MNTNDEKILLLQKQVDTKRARLKEISKFTPKTNCSLEFDGERVNIRALGKQKVLELLIELNLRLMSAKYLNLENDYMLCGYSLQDWTDDLKARFEVLNKKEEEAKLVKMEAKLNELLSNDKKVELELNQIAESLNL